MVAGGLARAQFGRMNTTSLAIDGVEVTATAAQLNTVGADSATLAQQAGSASGFRARKVAALALTGAAVAGGTQSWANPEAGAILIERAVLDVTTQSSAACTLDVGRTTVSATTSADTLLDGLSVASTGVFDSTNDTDNGSNGVAKTAKLASGGWVTVTQASGAAAGLVATLYIYYTVA